MSKLVLSLMAITVMSLVGCAHVQDFAAKYIPTVEAKASGLGVSLTVDPKLGIDAFCLDPVGTVTGILSKIPVVGAVVTETVGLCPVAEVAPEAAPVE